MTPRSGRSIAIPRAQARRQPASDRRLQAGHAGDEEPRHDEARISLLFEFFVTSQKIRHLLNRAMANSPLRADEYAVYSVLVDLGPQTPTAMARILGMPLTTLMEYARAMLSRGDARRSPNRSDRRSYLLRLTARGRRSHIAAGRALEVAKADLSAALVLPETDHVRTLHDLQAAVEAATDALGSRAKKSA